MDRFWKILENWQRVLRYVIVAEWLQTDFMKILALKVQMYPFQQKLKAEKYKEFSKIIKNGVYCYFYSK